MSDGRYHEVIEGYDVVIVGGGMAGGILAEELTRQDRDVRVLVLEAGANTSLSLEGYQSYVDHYFGAPAKVPNSPYPENPSAPSPSVLDNHNLILGVEDGLLEEDGPCQDPVPPEEEDPSEEELVEMGWVPTPDTTGYWVQKGPNPFSSNYLRQLGGTMLHWLGLTPRMLPSDFRMKELYGRTDYNWPLSYTDLKPYYRKAELEMGVAGDVEPQKKLLNRFGDLLEAANAPEEVVEECREYFDEDYVYPMKEVPSSYVDKAFQKGIKEEKLTFPTNGVEVPVEVMNLPAARNSTPNPDYDGGEGYTPVGSTGDDHLGQRCEGNASCVPICPVQAKYSALKTLKKALDRPSVRLLSQAVATRVLIDADNKNRITGIEFKRYPSDPGTLCLVKGKEKTVFVLAAHAVENAKILLASDAAKTSDQVGRNLMDHPYFLAWGLMPENVGAFRGPGTTSGIPSLRDGPFRNEHAAFRTDIANWGWNLAAGAPVSSVHDYVEKEHLFGSRLRERIAGEIPRQVRLGFLMEQLPSPGNRVTIDPRYRTAIGELRPVIHYHIDEYTLRGMKKARKLSVDIFKKLGIEDKSHYLKKKPGWVKYAESTDGRECGFNYGGSGHLVGTHRMGPTAGDSVVDKDLRTWDHPNLYLVGCGSMPTISTSNPTLTMTALAYRAAESILKDLGE